MKVEGRIRHCARKMRVDEGQKACIKELVVVCCGDGEENSNPQLFTF